MTVRISVYDLDRTITRRPTWTLFLLFAARRLAPWRLALVPLLAGPALARLFGLMDRDALKSAMHRLLLGQAVPQAKLEPVAEAFAERTVAANLRAGAIAQMAADRAAGRRIVIATAAHRFYAAAIARRLDMSDLVATEVQTIGQRISSRIAGANVYGPVKRAMLERWLTAQGLERDAVHVRFYSDHASDAPTFDWSDEPVAVSPHPALRRLATTRGWRIVGW